VTGVDDLMWRGMRVEDAAACAELMAAAERVDDTGENYSVDDVAEELADPSRDLDVDTIAVLDGGRLVAMGHLMGSTEVWDVHMIGCPGVVHPDYRGRGIGTELVQRQLAGAAELHAARHPTVPGKISFGVADHVGDAVELVRAAGLEANRQFFEMERDLRSGVPAPREPVAPWRLVPYTAGRDDEVRRAHNLAFRGHYGSTERDPATWKQWFTGNRNFRPELSFLMLDGTDEDAPVAAYLLGYFYDADLAATGRRDAWIGQLGTLPPYRGRGAGSVLLNQALAAYAGLGYDQAALSVDSANGSGALGLYQRVGFEVTKSWTSWERQIPVRTVG